jgi:hypothetical protein
MDHVSDPEVWGEVTDETFWKVITETENWKTGKSSYMIKNIRDIYVLIKTRPRPKPVKNQGYYGGAPMSSAGGSAPGTDDEDQGGWRKYSGGYRYKDYSNKKPDAAAGYKGDGPTMGPPHAYAQEEMRKAKEAKDVKDAESVEKDAAKTQAGNASTTKPTGSASSATPGNAPTTWFIGQTTPATFTEDFLPKTWKRVKAGDKCPWDERIAKCTREEYYMGK